MKYKMICIDMDGTLLNKRKKISEKSKEVIKNAHKKGIEIVVTTGRIYNSAAYFSHIIGVKSPVIAANGAIVREKNNDNIIYKASIPSSDCIDIINVLNKHKISFQFYTTDTIYCSNLIIKLANELFMPKQIGYEMLKINCVFINTIEEWKEIFKKNEGEIAKCIAISPNSKKIEIVKKSLKGLENIVCYGLGKRSIEINYKEVSKGNAVKILAEYYGITPNEIMCIGDNENDISMIKYAGFGVAMGNAINEVKMISDYVTNSNKDEGVSKVIEKFVI